MLDPKSGLLIETETEDESHQDHRILNSHTGVFSMSENTCIDLVSTSDEEPVTGEGISKGKKRVWRKNGKQEWLKIYEEYMQKHLKRQPQLLDLKGHLSKHTKVGRKGFRSSDPDCNDEIEEYINIEYLDADFNGHDKSRNILKEGSTNNDGFQNTDTNSIKRTVTVNGLKRISEYRRIGKDLQEVSESDSTTGITSVLEQSRLDPDSGNLEQTRNEEDLTQDLQLRGIAEDLVRDCSKTEKTFDEDLSVRDLDLDLKHKAGDNAEIEEYNDIEYLDEDFSKHDKIGKKKKVLQKVRLRNLQHNTLKLLKNSNICLFKCTKNQFVCYECQYRCSNMQTLRCHVEDNHTYNQISRKMLKEKHRFHKADITDLECRLCNVILNSLSELSKHLTDHDVRLKKGGSSLIPYKLCTELFICQLCEIEFTTRYYLHKHMDEHFLSHLCPKCNKGFPNPRSLKNHVCNKTLNKSFDGEYFNTTQLEDLGTVSKASNVKCRQCSETFRYDYNRLQHMIEKHNNNSKVFQCEFCPKIFMTVHWLTKHMNCVHEHELYS